jgi:hypothetical protein
MDSCKSRMSSLIFVFGIDLGTYEANILLLKQRRRESLIH